MQIVHDYYALHAIPELDRSLPKTLCYIRTCLSSLKCHAFSPAEGALCAYFDFGQPNTLAFRADTDALPIQEQTGLNYCSRHPGIMHACGHDGHTAILLELARRIHKKDSLPHNVLLLFQPAEETDGGAAALCDCGVLTQYRVKYIFGLHLFPKLPAGQIFSKAGPLMSYCSQINVTFTGKTGHIADRQRCADALAACCRFYSRADTIRRREDLLLKFGVLNGGTAPNIQCGRAELIGSVRSFDKKDLRSVQRQLTGICKWSAYLTGCRGQIFFADGYPAVNNPRKLHDTVLNLCPFHRLRQGFMTADDFSFYQQHVEGMYFLLGTGDTPPLHSGEFSFDPSVLCKGADYFEQLALRL